MERAKRRAAAEGRSLAALIEDALRRVLNARPPAAAGDRLSLPVSAARGGSIPGVDLNDSAALQDLEDRDVLRRLK